MIKYERPTERSDIGRFLGFDHVRLWVGNAKQAACYYIARFGFHPIAYQGLETGATDYCTHVIGLNDIKIALTCPLRAAEVEVNAHIKKHGDGVKDVAFRVEDCRHTWEAAVERGAISVRDPEELTDVHGTVIIASL
jgi:4-hydroxyphenylpyruvate dioxygenase